MHHGVRRVRRQQLLIRHPSRPVTGDSGCHRAIHRLVRRGPTLGATVFIPAIRAESAAPLVPVRTRALHRRRAALRRRRAALRRRPERSTGAASSSERPTASSERPARPSPERPARPSSTESSTGRPERRRPAHRGRAPGSTERARRRHRRRPRRRPEPTESSAASERHLAPVYRPNVHHLRPRSPAGVCDGIDSFDSIANTPNGTDGRCSTR